jgi:hypothetical protein
MHFWIEIKFTKTLSQYKQKDICKFNDDMQFQVIFYLLNWIFIKKI